MYASTEGGLKYLQRNLRNVEPVLMRFAVDYVRPGSSVWDVGANLGLFAFAAAGLAGKSGSVICIEPDGWLVSVLRRSARLNGSKVATVEVLTAAVSDRGGVSSFLIAEDSRATNSLAGYGYEVNQGAARDRYHVATVTLDSLLETFPAPSVLKVDVEGAECEVLRGATQMLREVRPVLNIEVGGQSEDEVTSILITNGYRLYDAESDLAVPRAVWSTLALPI